MKKGKCIYKMIEMCFQGLTSVPNFVRSIEKHVRHLVQSFFFWKNPFFRKKVSSFYFCLCFLYRCYMNVKFSKGPSASEVQDIESSIGRIKKTCIFFCSCSKRELYDGNHFSPQLMTFCCLHMRL